MVPELKIDETVLHLIELLDRISWYVTRVLYERSLYRCSFKKTFQDSGLILIYIVRSTCVVFYTIW